MNRNLPSFFTTWRNKSQRKPLILKGARQVGKTTSLKAFGNKEFKRVHTFNFERHRSIHSAFDGELNPDSIVNTLSLLTGSPISLESDLLIFDEIQECPRALSSLKYFCEDKPQAYVMAAGSLLGIALSQESFPVGKVEIHQLHPLSFTEFLIAIEKPELAETILQDEGPQATGVEETLLELFLHYCLTGGLPEIVQTYIDQSHKTLFERFEAVRERQKNLIETYENDMAKHSGKLNSLHIRRVWEDIPKQLSRVNSKFQFKNVIPGKRSFAAIEGPLDWLLNAGLAIQSSIINEAQVPLKNFTQHNQFRLFSFDLGILGAIADFPIQSILDMNQLGLIFKGHFLENYVAQTLHRYGLPMYTWNRNTSEIEFLIQTQRGLIVPIEVKSKMNSKAKSLDVFLSQYPETKEFAIFTPDPRHVGRHYPITWLEKLLQRWLK